MAKFKMKKEVEDKIGGPDHLPNGPIKAKNVKVKITTFVDLDVIEELKVQASKEGEKYQTLLNKYLRACVFKKVKESDLRVLSIASSW